MDKVDYETVAMILWFEIRQRCMIEGCRYTTIPLELAPNQKIEDKCIWCHELRAHNVVINPKGLLSEVFGDNA